jgi:myo-inositol-hexaphosphate 3-phosphohydrolase
MVVDQQTGILYAGQEDVGIWRVDLKTGLADASPFVLSTDYDPMSPLTQDIEGLTLYYGRNGTGYLMASSQGDNTFAVFDRQTLAYLGSFQVGAQGGIDAVEHSDGADVVGLALPGYPSGLFVTQDGENAPEGGTNFKYVPWQNIAGAMNLQIDPLAYDPRTLAPVPEPETWAMLLAGLGLVGWMARRRSV